MIGKMIVQAGIAAAMLAGGAAVYAAGSAEKPQATVERPPAEANGYLVPTTRGERDHEAKHDRRGRRDHHD